MRLVVVAGRDTLFDGTCLVGPVVGVESGEKEFTDDVLVGVGTRDPLFDA